MADRLIVGSALLNPFGRIFLALLSSFLLILSFPGPDHGWLAWVAFIPLLVACEGLPNYSIFFSRPFKWPLGAARGATILRL